jgi:hypothetical protein
MTRSIAIAALAGLSISEPASAKGRTVAIEIKGATLTMPITISDADIVSRFNIWNGPGVRVNGQPDHLNPDKEFGRFIDWPKGTVGERRTGVQRYEVTFRIETEGARNDAATKYLVLYEFDPTAAGGYIYLPRANDRSVAGGAPANGGLIYHGVEGNWFNSTDAWERLVRPVIERAAAAQ